MPTKMSFSGSTASGAESRTSIVASSTLRAPVTPRSWNARCELFASARSIENTASSAVKGLPSWKRTFGRSLNRQVRGSTACHDSASDGSSAKSRSRLSSDS